MYVPAMVACVTQAQQTAGNLLKSVHTSLTHIFSYTADAV